MGEKSPKQKPGKNNRGYGGYLGYWTLVLVIFIIGLLVGVGTSPIDVMCTCLITSFYDLSLSSAFEAYVCFLFLFFK